MADFPEYKRQETIQPGSSTPNFGATMRAVGEAQWSTLSSIGAKVAQTASTTMAQNWGYQMGQTPHGDLLPPITDFDKQVTDSYNAQAASTLQLQSNKMMLDAEVEMNKATRLTPDLIAKSQSQMAQGMSQILENAPSGIKDKLSYTFQNQLMQQTANYQLKMVSQDKEDQKNAALAALRQNSDTAFQLAASGNEKGAENVVSTSKAIADSGPANNWFSKMQAYVSTQTVSDAAKNGKYIRQAIDAKNNNKFEEWEKNFAKNKPKDLDYRQWNSVGNAVTSYMGTLNNMRAEDENLRVAKFKTAIAQDVNGITGSMIQDLQDNVSPARFEEAHLAYLKGIKSYQRENGAVDALINDFSNPEAFARATEKQKNGSFDKLVANTVNQSKNSPNPISQEDAEVQVAGSAGGTIPAFTNSLNNKAASANPNMIESFGRQVHALTQMGAGNALQGVNKEAKAVYTKYQALRDSMDANEAAKLAHEMVYDQDPATVEINQQKWTNFLSNKKPQGQTPDIFALNQVGLDPTKMRSPTVYGNDILEEYKTYYTMLNGDQVNAKKLLQQSVDQNYGETTINGTSEFTKHPIEKVLNLPPDATGVVQEDIMEQLQAHFAEGKKAYTGYTDENGNKVKPSVNEYWEVVPRRGTSELIKERDEIRKSSIEHGAKPNSMMAMNADRVQIEQFSKGQTIQVVQHMRGGKSQKYNVVIQMNPFATNNGVGAQPIVGGWDIAVDSGSGLRPLTREAPYLGVVNYNPNVKKITANYNALHSIKD